MLQRQRSINLSLNRFTNVVHQWGSNKMGTPLQKAVNMIKNRKRGNRAMQYQQEQFHAEDPIASEMTMTESDMYLRGSSFLDTQFERLSAIDLETSRSLGSSRLGRPSIDSSPSKQRQVTFSDQVEFVDYPSMTRRWSQTTCLSPVVQQDYRDEGMVPQHKATNTLPAMKVWNIDDSAQFVQLMENSPTSH